MIGVLMILNSLMDEQKTFIFILQIHFIPEIFHLVQHDIYSRYLIPISFIFQQIEIYSSILHQFSKQLFDNLIMLLKS